MGIISKDKKLPTLSSTKPCASLRSAYHSCFNRWYSEKFAKGQWDKMECVSEWESYRDCLSKHLEDKQLRRFLEAELVPSDLVNSAASTTRTN
ncbi:Uncharacterized protein At4g33100 [Linum grandiflorum]